MPLAENAGNYNEIIRERNIRKTVLFLRRLREHHPEREVKLQTPDLDESAGFETWPEAPAPEPAPDPVPVPVVVPSLVKGWPTNPVDTIGRAACAHFNMTLAAMLSGRRDAEYVRARQIVMYLTRTLACTSLPNIARRMGGLDHTTVHHGVRRIKQRMATEQALFDDVAAIQARAIEVDPKLGAMI